MAREHSRRRPGAWPPRPGRGTLAAVGAVAIVAGLATVALGEAGLPVAFPAGGLGVVVALGLATDGEDGIARLAEAARRVADGDEDVSFPTDREDEVGDLAMALEDLTGTLADCRQDRAAAQQRAEESEARLSRYRTLVESAGDPMAVLDEAGRFEVLNPEMAAFHGRDREALVGADATELVSTEGVAAIEDAQRRLLADPDERWEQVELTLTDAGGAEHRFEAHVGIRRDDDGAFAGSVLTFRDVTERVAVEAELREHERTLAARKDRLEAQNRALRGLYEIGADVDLTLAEKIQRVLDIGREHLGTDGAFLSRIDPESDHFEFVHTSGTGEPLQPGTVAPFSETYCRKTIGTDEVLQVADAPAEGWLGDPAYDRWGFDRYVGGKVFVEDDLVGTIGFVDEDAASPLSDDQLTFVDLAAQWLGYELERERREQRLEEYKEYTDDVLDAVDDVFYVIDEEGTLKRWNRSLVTATGYDDGEIAGMHALELFPADDEERVTAAIEEGFETGSASVEADFLTTDGDRIPYEFVATRLEDTDGNPVVTGIGRDITERTERQRELRETRDRLEAIIEASPAALIALDLDDRVTRWNPAAEEIFGWTEAEVLGEPMPTAREDDLAADHQSYFQRVLEGETITGAETTRRTKDGDLIDVSLSIAPIRDADGGIVGSMGALQDITERKERERALRETNERLNAVVEASPDAIIVIDTDGVVELWNPAAEDIFGWSAAEVTGEPLPFVPPDRTGEFDALLERLLDGETLTGVETKRQTRDGDLVDVNLSAAPLRGNGEVVGIMGIMEDISTRKAYERELELTTSLLSRAEEMAGVGGWSVEVVDGQPRNPQWTAKLYDIFELPPDVEAPTREVFEYYYPEDRDRHRAALDRALETGESWDQELRLRTAEGTERWVRNIGEPTTADGEVVQISGSIQDITARKERERELREREQRLEEYKEYTDDVLDAIDDVFYVIDDEGTFLRWNETAEAMTGYSADEIEATNALEFFPEAVHDQILEAIDDVFGSAQSRRVEAPLVTNDGKQIPYEFIATPVVDPDGQEVLVGIGRDITERKRREAALERTTELLEQAQRIARVGGWEFDVETEALTVSDEFRRIHGLPETGTVSLADVMARYHQDDVAEVEETVTRAIEDGEGDDMEVRLETDESDVRWVRTLAEPVVRDGETVAIRGSTQDITDAKEREQAIRSLHDAAQGLLGTETTTEVSSLVVETAAAVLDVSGVCLYVLDGEASQLVPSAATDSYEAMTDGAPPIPVGDEDDPVWNAFATGSRRVVDERAEADGRGPFTDTVAGGLIVPVGDHGVLVVTTTNPGVGVETRHLVETLVATTEAALDRLETEADLRERDAELAEQNRRLRRQIQLTDVLRRVDRSLVGANSETEIEEAVCEELADSEDIAFAWIGSLDAAGDAIVPETWAGAGEGYLDAVSLATDDRGEPAARTASAGEPTAVSNVLAEVSGEPWRKTALDAGFRSVVAVPIAFEDYRHGVLAVYATEAETFGDLEETVFAELGQTIANAINAVQTREALHADTLLELTLEIDAPDTFFVQLARRADCPVEYVGLGAQSEETTSVFFAADPDAPIEAALEDMVAVAEYRRLSDRDDRSVYEATVRGTSLPAKLLRHGAHPTAIQATPSGLSVVVAVPTTTAVREFVEMLEESHSNVELAGRRNVTRATRTHQEMVSDLLADLTDRQLEVLRTAYFAGYFDWPRGSSGQEVADLLGISQPTVSRHLRLAQRQLLADLLEEEPTTLTAS